MIKIRLQYEWQPQPGRGAVVNAVLFDVLYAVHETGLLAEAARRVGMSYRHVWGLMGKWERIFGRPLVALRKGRGASLTDFGRKLLWAEQLVQARLVPELESVRHAIGKVLAPIERLLGTTLLSSSTVNSIRNRGLGFPNTGLR